MSSKVGIEIYFESLPSTLDPKLSSLAILSSQHQFPARYHTGNDQKVRGVEHVSILLRLYPSVIRTGRIQRKSVPSKSRWSTQ